MQTGRTPIEGIWLGLLGGIIGAVIGAIVWDLIAMTTGYLLGEVAMLCGFVGGIGFGILTKGNKNIVGFVGIFFGLISIFLGYSLIYVTPIHLPTYISVRPSSLMSFPEFWTLFVEPLDYFFMLIGAGAGFVGARFAEGRLFNMLRPQPTPVRPVPQIPPPTPPPRPVPEALRPERINYVSGSQCNVCRLDLTRFDTILQCPSCKKTFHDGCLQAWIELNQTCPSCNKALQTPESNNA